jgi:hypothetical protein
VHAIEFQHRFHGVDMVSLHARSQAFAELSVRDIGVRYNKDKAHVQALLEEENVVR